MLHRGCVVMLLRVLVLVLCMCVFSTFSYTTPPVMPTFPEKPCGEFPWPADDREYTVNCDYSYTSFPDFFEVEPQGRCKVRCPPNSTEFLVGPPFDGNKGLTDGLYYCNRVNGTWLGSQPVCLGFYNNATMVTDESKGIRLVGGASYGYVELFDNVTQQWGPVRGRLYNLDDPFDNAQMELVDLACRNLRFSSGLATTAYVRKDWWEDDMWWPLEEHSEITPLQYRYVPPGYPPEAPKFVLSKSAIPPGEGVTLRDVIDRVVRGPCAEGDRDCAVGAFCLACEGQQASAHASVLVESQAISESQATSGAANHLFPVSVYVIARACAVYAVNLLLIATAVA